MTLKRGLVRRPLWHYVAAKTGVQRAPRPQREGCYDDCLLAQMFMYLVAWLYLLPIHIYLVA